MESGALRGTTRKRRPLVESDASLATSPLIEGKALAYDGNNGKPRYAKKGTLARLVQFARPEAARIGTALGALVISSASNMALPTIMGKIVDRTAGGDTGGVTDAVFLAGAFGVFAVGSLGSFVRAYNFGVATHRLRARLRQALFAALLRQEASFFDALRSGELSSVVDHDAEAAALVCTDRLAAGLRSLSSALNGSVMLFLLSPRLMLLSVSVVPFVGSGAMLYAKYVKRLNAALADMTARATAFCEERLANIRTVRLFARESAEAKAYAACSDASAATAAKAAAAQGGLMGGLSLTVNASLVAVLYFGGSIVARGDLTVGKLTSFAIYSTLVGLGFSGLSSVFADVGRGLASASRVFELLDREPAVDIDAGDELPRGAVKGAVRFEGVRFRYPLRDQDVLCGLDLEMKPGQVVALAGGSGAGKSTAAALLCRLYEPLEGRVTLDGVDLATLKPSWLRSAVGVVEQEPVLFSGTVGENIRFGRPNATDADVVRAAKEANCHDFVSAFPLGYDTPVGEHGRLLSGGQRQRVAIARAILKDPPLLILDEATSALTQRSERLVAEALERAMWGRTVLVIAHRLSTVRRADVVAVLEGGRITEMGSFDELMAKPEGTLQKLMDGGGIAPEAAAALVQDAEM